MGDKKLLYEIVKNEHPITVRGCFYRAVSAGLFPGTQESYYQKCVRLLQQMRREVANPKLYTIPYEWIVDTSRSRSSSGGYLGLDSFIDSIIDSYSRNYWVDQPTRVEVMTEKDAMATILSPVINKWNVPFTVFRGNPSDTMCYDLGKEFENVENVVVLYLGDFDPSGLNISRVAWSKIERFADRKIEWVRIAVHKTQFERMRDQFGIPVKRGDKLAPAYIEKYGSLCVEVDAIPSNEIRDLLEKAIVKRIDMDLWKQTEIIEKGEQAELDRLVSKLK